MTPHIAMVANLLVGCMALATGRTGDIIIIACFGALALYIISLISFFAIRIKHPSLYRPFTSPFYPFIPGLALLFSSIAFISMIWNYPFLSVVFGSLLFLGFILIQLQKKGKHTEVKA